MTSNPLAYINHLRGVGAALRAQVDAASEIQARIVALQAELSALEVSTSAQVAEHWSPGEIQEAMADANRLAESVRSENAGVLHRCGFAACNVRPRR